MKKFFLIFIVIIAFFACVTEEEQEITEPQPEPIKEEIEIVNDNQLDFGDLATCDYYTNLVLTDQPTLLATAFDTVDDGFTFFYKEKNNYVGKKVGYEEGLELIAAKSMNFSPYRTYLRWELKPDVQKDIDTIFESFTEHYQIIILVRNAVNDKDLGIFLWIRSATGYKLRACYI
ncbi:MAG: hypothetical protein JXR63_08470 [Spirochaetales bacterium]|nr:hypothetical protein [Spirochaetales bacterium]